MDAHILDAGAQHLLFGPKLLLRTCRTPLSCRLFTRKLTYPLRRVPCSLQTNAMCCPPLFRSSGRHNCTQSYVILRSDPPVPTDTWIMRFFQHLKINIHQTHIIDRNQSTVMHHAQIKCDNMFLWLGLSQSFFLPPWRTHFLIFLWNNIVNALPHCRTFTRYQFHTSLRLRLPNHNSNKINVSQISVRFTLSASNKTNSTIGPTNQNNQFQQHQLQQHQPSPFNMEHSAASSGSSASSAPTFTTASSRYYFCPCFSHTLIPYFRFDAWNEHSVSLTSCTSPLSGVLFTISSLCSWPLLQPGIITNPS